MNKIKHSILYLFITLIGVSLNAQEKKTLEIAKDHLGTSFNIKKSIGYITWKTKKENST